jgi:ornithine cyclodeaminase/alanine dehydrogenase-like protein (mu-crystallin family)
MRLLSEKVIDEILPLGLAIDSADEAFRVYSGKAATIPLRSEIHRENPRGTALVMSGLIGNEVLGVKLVGSVASATQRAGKHTTCMMMIWDARDLRVRGVLSADALNEHRTAAGFASATRALARPDAQVHLVIGAGKLAFTAALYASQVRPIGRVLLASRSAERVAALAAKLRADPRLQADVLTNVDPSTAVEQADIITTVTTSEYPVFKGSRVRPGTHINLGGAARRNEREMDDDAARRAVFWVDSSDACRQRAGDIVLPLESGAIREEQIRGEIGELLLGRIPGRANSDEITVFKSLGIASQDLILGARLLDLAEARELGTVFDEKGR